MTSTNPATPELLARLAALYPESWYIAASVAFSCSNYPEAIPKVFEAAAVGLSADEQLFLARRIRDAVFKGGVLTGYAKAINSLVALHESLPEALQSKSAERPLDTVTMDDIRAHGKSFFVALYGDTADSVQALLDGISPDMGFMSSTIAYGFVYGGTPHLHSQMESSFVQISALVAGDTPRQVGWHLANVRRIGATKDQANAIRQIAIDVAKACGVRWRNEIPEVPDV